MKMFLYSYINIYIHIYSFHQTVVSHAFVLFKAVKVFERRDGWLKIVLPTFGAKNYQLQPEYIQHLF